MKKILSLMLVGIMTLTMLVGCGSVSNDNIKIKKYKGLEVEKVVTADVTDEDVEASIKSDLETLATTEEIKNRPAQKGDIVVIDFVGKENGVEFEGGSGKDTRLELGTGAFIPGFEDQAGQQTHQCTGDHAQDDRVHRADAEEDICHTA
jgi:trigger factor